MVVFFAKRTLPVAIASWKASRGRRNWKLAKQLPASNLFAANPSSFELPYNPNRLTIKSNRINDLSHICVRDISIFRTENTTPNLILLLGLKVK